MSRDIKELTTEEIIEELELRGAVVETISPSRLWRAKEILEENQCCDFLIFIKDRDDCDDEKLYYDYGDGVYEEDM